MLEDDFNNFDETPQDVYTQTQLAMLNEIEGMHEHQPDKEALIISRHLRKLSKLCCG